jgi:hypothetical protein
MPYLIALFLPAALASLSPRHTPAEQPCRTFRECYDLAVDAREAADTARAIEYYAAACTFRVERVYGALHIAACDWIIRLSEPLDGYATATAFFRKRCADGSDEGCFFLGTLAARRDSFAVALSILRPLCEERFDLPAVHGYNACTRVRQIEQVIRAREPEELRTGPLQLAAFIAIFGLTLISAMVFAWAIASKNVVLGRATVGLSMLALLAYGYYESGIPSHYAIRVDLLLIVPALAINVILVGGYVVLARSRRQRPH